SMDYSRWDYNVSCCREVIISLRLAEGFSMIVATILAIVFIRALFKTKVLHSNLRALFLATTLTDSVIMYSRIYDLLHTDGRVREHVGVMISKHVGWLFDVHLVYLMLVERYYAIKHNDTYDEISMDVPVRTISLIIVVLIATSALSVPAATGILLPSFYFLKLFINMTSAIF
ncbi:hypothetical protein PENTCL1PPCAC_14562, partial [Pristionchus entomophagus]